MPSAKRLRCAGKWSALIAAAYLLTPTALLRAGHAPATASEPGPIAVSPTPEQFTDRGALPLLEAPTRPMTVEDAAGAVWYNGRRIPLVNARTSPVSGRDVRNAGPAQRAAPGTLPSSPRHPADSAALSDDGATAPVLRAGAPVACTHGVGCQNPHDDMGVGEGRGTAGFPVDANLEDANGRVLGAVSDASAGAGGAHSYHAADNFRVATSGTINHICWWGFYAPTTGAVIPGTGAEDCAGIVPGGAHDLGSATGTFGYVTGTNNSTPTASNCSQYGGTSGARFDNDVWFRWTAPCTSVVTFETCTSTTLDTKIAVYTATGGGANGCPTSQTTLVPAFGGSGLNGYACADDSDCGVDYQSFVQFQATAGTVYILRLGLFPDTADFPGRAGAFNIRCADEDCAAGADDFTVTFYADDLDGTLPGTPLAQFSTGSGLTLDSRTATGNVVTSEVAGVLEQYQYEATLAGGLPVSAGECYWVEIRNNITGACDWYWQSSPAGDGRSNVDIDGGGYLQLVSNNLRYDAYDLAYCLDVATDPDACFPIIPDPVLYQQTNFDFFGAIGYAQQYQIYRPYGNSPHAITYIAARAGATGCDPNLAGTELFALIEFYDDFVATAGTYEPVHRHYLGGVITSLGVYDGEGSQYVDFSIAALPGTYFVSTGADNKLVVALRLGQVVAGVFEAEPANNDAYTHTPCGTGTNAGARMSFLFGVESGSLNEVVGAHVASTYYRDGFGVPPADDRVHLGGDGPLTWGLEDEGAPVLELRGLLTLDCNGNGTPDDEEIRCWESGVTGTGGCGPNECPIYDALGTDGLQRSPLFMNPLMETGLGAATCIPAGPDENGNGIIDSCDALCATYPIPNPCRVSCSNTDWVHGKSCQQAVNDGDIATCGVASDCNLNGIADDCEIDPNESIRAPDCNANDLPDECDIVPLGTDPDCNADGVPDACEIAAGMARDCDGNGAIDRCERPYYYDCNYNNVEDYCDILAGTSQDHDADAFPDECVPACVTPFDGFEHNPPFKLGTKVDGIDDLTPGNGDVWATGADLATATIVTPPACPGWGTRALAQNSDTNGIPGSGVFGPTTTSELFKSDALGRAPDSAYITELSFDWQVVGPRNSDNDIRMFIYDGAGNTRDAITILWFASDISRVGVDEPGTLHILGGGGFFSTTGVPLVPGECNKTRVIFNNPEQSVEIQIARNGGPFNTVYGPTPGNVLDITGATRIDFITLNAFNSGGLPQNSNDAASLLLLDNFQLCERVAALGCVGVVGPDGQPSANCNADNICDAYQLSVASDCNANGSLDVCDACADADGDGIVDTAIVQQFTGCLAGPLGSVAPGCECILDFDKNGVIDLVDYAGLQSCAAAD